MTQAVRALDGAPAGRSADFSALVSRSFFGLLATSPVAEVARARLARKRTFASKVTELARILDEDGYMASVEPLGGGAFRIAERNCAIFAVASEHAQACSTELEFLRAALPEAQIERVTHMMAGAHACSYEVRKRP